MILDVCIFLAEKCFQILHILLSIEVYTPLLQTNDVRIVGEDDIIGSNLSSSPLIPKAATLKVTNPQIVLGFKTFPKMDRG